MSNVALTDTDFTSIACKLQLYAHLFKSALPLLPLTHTKNCLQFYRKSRSSEDNQTLGTGVRKHQKKPHGIKN